ncbi:Glutathione S-transferase GST-4.5 [Paramyrothecium foliicola]|nr:Glutathione S-transferase GST-4.5 [Paramyrothecium foliicola]
MAPELTLYRVNGACSFAVHCVLRELNIPFSHVLLKPGPDGYEAADGSFTNQQYRQTINESGFVPALKVGDKVLTEMPALLTFIPTLAPSRTGGRLLGANDLQRASVVQWLAWLSGTLHGRAFGMAFRPARFTDDPAQYAALQDRGRRVAQDCFGSMEAYLRGRDFFVGDALTVVDFNATVFWRWGLEIGVPMHERYPCYTALVRRMEALESVQAAIAVEGLRMFFSKA